MPCSTLLECSLFFFHAALSDAGNIKGNLPNAHPGEEYYSRTLFDSLFFVSFVFRMRLPCAYRSNSAGVGRHRDDEYNYGLDKFYLQHSRLTAYFLKPTSLGLMVDTFGSL
jgi:hypothetical protein